MNEPLKNKKRGDLRSTPHKCGDPTCPGDVNRRKLEMFGELVSALAGLTVLSMSGIQARDVLLEAEALLARAKELQ